MPPPRLHYQTDAQLAVPSQTSARVHYRIMCAKLFPLGGMGDDRAVIDLFTLNIDQRSSLLSSIVFAGNIASLASSFACCIERVHIYHYIRIYAQHTHLPSSPGSHSSFCSSIVRQIQRRSETRQHGWHSAYLHVLPRQVCAEHL